MESWTESQRHISWSLLSFARMRLNLPLETCTASAFMMVHKYFLQNTQTEHSLFIILVTALFSACKMNETVRSMQQVYSEILNCCRDSKRRIGEQRLIDNLGRTKFEESKLTQEEIGEINTCELDLLEADNFNMKIDLPFQHIDKNVRPYLKKYNAELRQSLNNKLVKNICMFLCFHKTAAMPTLLLAIVATESAFDGIEMPPETQNWINDKKSDFEISQYQLATELLAKQAAILNPQQQQKAPQ
ncbi:hypothetical protein TVAG_401360 [Trichomonas vaginalis G3]|uniref:Cyclin, N-terminal domain containing protein n=1 Tax=Trichomonas vaginalis (strain ATCC PRA-98 / G3) TaxID=412133 RepID=A2EGA3_TRIV3|nr:cyclin domain-containing protein [Trichomonas vaginalis G3]EAY08282.1 hypothetical protein TVAG_401360 [Trichomonas vaginalis G3]KAI5546124.1 cyclin domain-containing protein [Trichomonas vaginalis G3]|eukprot:XP_001320505.1 hypothetical protein [Trichomonas vaginalis G3]